MSIGNKLLDKIAIVTGGAQGIGEAICHYYAKEGATVIIADKNNFVAETKVVQQIKEFGGKAEAVACDVTNQEQVQHLVNQVMSKYGKIDILVNNAGVFVFKDLEAHTLADWDFMIDTNLKGPFLLSRAVAPLMKKQKQGRIIFIVSMAASVGFAGASAYSASKGGLLALAKTLVAELAPHGINVNTISPGNIETAINESVRKNPDFVKLMASKTPTGIAYMHPNEIAGAALFLASDDAKSIHGLDLIVDNGWTAV